MLHLIWDGEKGDREGDSDVLGWSEHGGTNPYHPGILDWKYYSTWNSKK